MPEGQPSFEEISQKLERPWAHRWEISNKKGGGVIFQEAVPLSEKNKVDKLMEIRVNWYVPIQDAFMIYTQI